MYEQKKLFPSSNLVPYGIQTEESDVRIHVCPIAAVVYLYQTQNGLRAIESGLYPLTSVYDDGIETAQGYLVPPNMIVGCLGYKLRPDLWNAYPFTEQMDTSEKGDQAACLVAAALRKGLLGLPLPCEIITERELQIAGVDLIVEAKLRIQVKCDLRGGERQFGGTGNLFLQIAEHNVQKSY